MVLFFTVATASTYAGIFKVYASINHTLSAWYYGSERVNPAITIGKPHTSKKNNPTRSIVKVRES
jgi:hypothetical protein